MNRQKRKIIFVNLAIVLMLIACKNPPVANIAASKHGEVILQAQCLSCHGDDLIKQQRLSKIGWTREVEKMMRWGATINDQEKEPLVEFLAANYPARSLAKNADAPDVKLAANGKILYESKCLTCHGEDIIQQQRLSKIGWTKEVEKMARWGAEVSDEEKIAMVEYLLTKNNAPKN